MGDEGEGYFSHSEILYDNVEVSEKNLLGDEGYGFKIAQSRLGPGRVHHCMRWIGICERSFDMMFGSKKSKIEISMIKFYCANVLKRVIDDAVQIHGGLGMSDDIILSHFYRHERAARIYDGADEVHISSVAKGILSNYGLKI